jgi:hypothetical protein
MSLVSDVVYVDAGRRLHLTASVQAWPDVDTAEAILVFKQLRTMSRKTHQFRSDGKVSHFCCRWPFGSVATLNILRGLAWFYSLHQFERRTLGNGPCPVPILTLNAVHSDVFF